jgi:hypothetical protein
MRSKMHGRSFMRVLSAAGTLLLASPLAFAAGSLPPGIPDPCTLVTAAELQAIVGALKGAPKAGDATSGDISCEYAMANGPRWISVRLHDGDLAAWKRRNGGANPIALPDLSKDAFANADAEGSADVYAMKGKLILRVTMPKGPQAVEMDKAIAKKALARMP